MEVTEYIEKNLPTTMDSVIGLLDRVEKEIVNEMRQNPVHSIHYYNGLINLLDKIITEIASRKIFKAPEGWFYVFSITNKNAALYLKHVKRIKESEDGKIFLDIDETFRLINYPVKLLSVEEYASLNKTETVTVRQWIRRGKLRNAIKVGGEWRIPQISDTPSRGYTPVRYYNNGNFLPLPKEFGFVFIQSPCVIDIYQATKGKGYIIRFDHAPAVLPDRLFSEAEREKLELMLISNPNVTNSSSVVGEWPVINTVEKLVSITRSGDMRLPEGWDVNLF